MVYRLVRRKGCSSLGSKPASTSVTSNLSMLSSVVFISSTVDKGHDAIKLWVVVVFLCDFFWREGLEEAPDGGVGVLEILCAFKVAACSEERFTKRPFTLILLSARFFRQLYRIFYSKHGVLAYH